MAKCPPLLFVTIFFVLAIKVRCQDLDLLDAIADPDDETPTMKPNSGATGGGAGGAGGGGAGGAGGGSPGDGMKTITNTPARPKGRLTLSEDLNIWDAFDEMEDETPTMKPNPGMTRGGAGGGRSGGGQFTDGGGYVPDKGRAGGRPSAVNSVDDTTSDTAMESGTIAGIVSALAMTLLGAAGSYISYQKKRLCFSVQESLNAAYIKGENPEDVV